MRVRASQHRPMPARLWVGGDQFRKNCGIPPPPPPPPPPDRRRYAFIAGFSFPIPGIVIFLPDGFSVLRKSSLRKQCRHKQYAPQTLGVWKILRFCSERWACAFGNYAFSKAIPKKVLPTNVGCTGLSWALLSAGKAI